MAEEELAELAREKNRKNNSSIITDLFEGEIKQSFDCHDCNKVSRRFETFRTIPVPIP